MRDLLPVAPGLLAAWILSRWAPLAAGDSLRSTLVALPVVWALFVALDRRLPGPLGRISSAEWCALVLLLGAIIGCAHLGIDGADHVVLAGWALFVGHRALRTLVGLRPGLGRRLAPRAPLDLFLLPLAVYLAILPWSTDQRPPDGDEPWNLLIAHSIAYDLDTDLANNYAQQDSLRFLDRALEPQPGDPMRESGEIYSRHAPTFPAVLAPAYRVGGKEGALVFVALITSLLAWLAFRVFAQTWPELGGPLLLQWGLLAMAPPLLLYSHQVWIEVPAALLIVLGYDRLLALESASEDGGGSRSAWAGFVFALALLPLVKLRFGLVSFSLLALAFVRLPRARRALSALAAFGALAASAYLLINARLFGNALRIHDAEELLLFRIPIRDYLANGSGLFFDHAFGLFACAPLWLLLIPGLVETWRRRRRLPLDLAIVALPYLVLVASRREWYGGWSPPFRYGLALLPLLALTGVPAWSARGRNRAALVVAPLAVLTALATILYVVEPGWAYSFADGRSRLVDAISSRIGADLAQWLPSATRVRFATWLWPLLVVPALLALWPWRSRRRSLRPAAALAGAALLVGSAILLPLAARARTTRSIEAESPHVAKAGGHVDPEPWVFDRRRFPEAWALREGESLRAPVNAGGRQVELIVHARFIRNRNVGLDLELLCGERKLGALRWEEHDVWKQRAFGPVEWTAGQPLVLRIPPPQGPGEPGVVNGVILDRVDLIWKR